MKDNFSRLADRYAKYRPNYPRELFDFILDQVKEREAAWDVATGNGQTAKELCQHFEKVFATDISRKQLDEAYQSPNIFYSLQPAEQTDFPANSFSLITVSQALHWFQFDKFYTEVKRVSKPGGWLAVWTYPLLNITPEIDNLIGIDFYKNTLGAYWDEERKYVEEHYATLPFPFKEIKCPAFQIRFDWTIEELEGYLNTWSAVQKFIVANNYNPVPDIMKRIKSFWKEEKMKIIFPVYMRMGQVEK